MLLISIFTIVAKIYKGAICLDTLGSAWSPVLTIKSALLSLQSLLSTPEPKDPQDAEVASMLMNFPEKFQRKAREWAITHAGAPAKTNWSMNTPSVPSQAKTKVQRSKEEEARAEALRYLFLLHSLWNMLTKMLDIKDTTRT